MKDNCPNREYWNEKMTAYLSDCFWDNLTDFNYTTCHTYFVAADENRFAIGSQELGAFLSTGNVAYYVKMQISCKAPLMCVAFCKYDGSPTEFSTSGNPYTGAQKEIYGKIKQLADESNLQIALCSDMPDATYQEYFETEAYA